MKYVKMLSLVAVASAVLGILGGVGSASATVLTCGSGTQCAAETIIKAESEGKAVLDAPFGNVECRATVEGHTTNAAGSADGPITAISVTECGSDTVTTLSTGSFSDTTSPPKTTGTKITVIHLGVHCIYETSNTAMGRGTGSKVTGSNATIDISATIPRVGGNGGAFCGSSAPLTGSFKVISPNPLDAD
ncbi:MAG: hypothetical protein ACTHO8_10750 [Solirubrobacterales bacterium]